MLFFGPQGNLVWGSINDPKDSRPIPLGKNLAPWVTSTHPLVSPPSTHMEVRGLIRIPAGIMLVTAFPVLRSDESGPAVGSVVVGRFLTPALSTELGQAASTKASFYALTGSALPAPEKRAVAALSASSQATLYEQTDKLTYARTLLNDVTGKPVVLLEVHTPRVISLIGSKTVLSALLFLSLAIVLFIVMEWALLRHWILGPVLALQRHITAMRTSGNLATRFTTAREDEIGTLAAEFNRLAQELNQTQVELEKTRDQALELADVKGRFLATMSHEIRTPMNGVLGMAALLQDTHLDERQQEFVKSIQSSGDLLLTVINDILDFSRIEAGKLVPESSEFDLRKLVEDSVDLLAVQAHAKGLELVLSLPTEIEYDFIGDANRLNQILINLLSNAIKFTRQGEVRVKVTIRQQKSKRADIQIEVHDTGIGIRSEQQDNIFEAFSQADNRLARSYGGTGLGLSISRQLVELMGGEIGLKSKIGHGSNFWVTLQLPTTVRPAPALKLPPEFAELRTLIVDDNAASRKTLGQQLRAWGIQSETAANGPDALKILLQASVDHAPYALLLLDWNMPVMDGLKVIKKIAAHAAIIQPYTIVLGPAAHADEELAASQPGVVQLLSKPVRRNKLYDSLQQLMSKNVVGKTGQAQRVPAKPADPTFAASVLLVEDNEVNQEVACLMLEELGCEVVIATDGASALGILRDENFDLILMDCQMPQMDGFEATERFREIESAGQVHTPIVALTANVMEGVRERCLRVGMDDFLAKPFSKSQLQGILQTWLNPA